MYLIFSLLCALANCAYSSANEVHFTSGKNRVYLLELYSSQGCSSCPPAQRWVNQLQGSEALWEQVIPVVFHVDYWNYLGWKDPFSKPQFSFRQRAHKHQGNIKSVYTPGFVVNGNEWKGWFRGQGLNLIESDAGILSFTMEKNKAMQRQFTAQFHQQSQEPNNKLELKVALLGMNNKTKVRAGENRAKELTESFIVLELMTFQTTNIEHQKTTSQTNKTVFFSGVISMIVEADALAIWVNDKNSLHPIQSTGGYF